MRDPNFGNDGMLREITRIEFNVLEFGRFQRNIWSDDVLMESEVGCPADIDRLFGSAALLVLPPGVRRHDRRRQLERVPADHFPLGSGFRDAVEKYCHKHKIDSPSQLARQALAEKIGRPDLARMRRRGRPKAED